MMPFYASRGYHPKSSPFLVKDQEALPALEEFAKKYTLHQDILLLELSHAQAQMKREKRIATTSWRQGLAGPSQH